METKEYPWYELIENQDKFVQIIKKQKEEYSTNFPEHLSQEVWNFFDLILSTPVRNLTILLQETQFRDIFKVRVRLVKTKKWKHVDKPNARNSLTKLFKTSCKEIKYDSTS